MILDDFKTVWVVDFEFKVAAGGRPEPVCLVAHEVRSGQTLRLWRDQWGQACPYDLGPDSLLVAFYASAEMGCHLALNWPLPTNVLDLYAEFRVETNGRTLANGNGLLGALAYYGQQGIAAMEKDAMRQLILSEGERTTAERLSILKYCESDVTATSKLLVAMNALFLGDQRLGQALLRGRYAKAVGRIEDAGIPIDRELLGRLRLHWSSLQDLLIARVDEHYEVYDGRSFRIARFVDYLNRHNIAFPDDLWKQASEAASAEGRSIGSWIRQLIRKALKH